ncbi:MAG: T9SS type A sorting domain-containing protein [Saprospiraceae bacterium]|nr:T9SS type A sorting domain-containing protein [Saprospiraceae bacterium]
MMKCILISALSLLSSFLYSQPLEVALRTNPSIYSNVNSHSRQVDVPQIKVYVPQGGMSTYCPSLRLIQGELDSVSYSFCKDLIFGEVIMVDSCLMYQSSGIKGQDLVCMQLCDIDGICSDFEIVFVTVGSTTVPFSDDFSYDGPYPDSNLWVTDDVFVNYTLAENPLSLGIATFDGLDDRGRPYPQGSLFSDELTSKFIDITETQDPFLSFFVQPKGNGIKPNTGDSLMLDFRNKDGEWVRVWQQEGLPRDFPINRMSPDFAFQLLSLSEEFIHPFFQFRFQNRSRNDGLKELWHLEYVRLGASAETREVFEDIAFTAPPKSVLSPYSNMPSSHFDPKEVRSNVVSAFYNFDGVPLAMSDPTVTMIYEGQTLMQRTLIEPVQNWTLERGHTGYDFELNDGGSMNVELLQEAMQNVIVSGKNQKVTALLDFSRASEIVNGNQNNQAETTATFANFFSYDDGSAESAIIDRGGPGVRSTTFAIEFHTNVEDQLQGVQFQFPHIEGNFSSQLFTLLVWTDSLDDTPEFEQKFLRPYYATEFFDTLQGFTTYDLKDSSGAKVSIPLPEGKFYIGWEQLELSGVKIPVGYDINSPEGAQFFYFNVGGNWINVDEAGSIRKGALMVRPVVGNEEVISTPIDDFDNSTGSLTLFPNPSKGVIHIRSTLARPELWQLKVFDTTGRLVKQSAFKRNVDLSSLPPGTYFLQAINRTFGHQISKKLTLLQ